MPARIGRQRRKNVYEILTKWCDYFQTLYKILANVQRRCRSRPDANCLEARPGPQLNHRRDGTSSRKRSIAVSGASTMTPSSVSSEYSASKPFTTAYAPAAIEFRMRELHESMVPFAAVALRETRRDEHQPHLDELVSVIASLERKHELSVPGVEPEGQEGGRCRASDGTSRTMRAPCATAPFNTRTLVPARSSGCEGPAARRGLPAASTAGRRIPSNAGTTERLWSASAVANAPVRNPCDGQGHHGDRCFAAKRLFTRCHCCRP